MKQRLLLTSLMSLFIIGSLSAQTALSEGITWYKKRAEGGSEVSALPGPINQAIEYFERAVQNPPEAEQAAEYLLKSYFFKGTFVAQDKRGKVDVFTKGKNLGKEFYEKFPQSTGVKFWYLVNLGKWGETKGVLAAAKEGLLGTMRTISNDIASLDPAYEDAAAHRTLGMLHHKAPYIPFLITWPDPEKAKMHLEKSLDIAPSAPGNHLSYAEVMFSLGYKEKATQILKRLVTFQPRNEYLMEDKMEIKEAEKLLKKYLPK